MAIETHYYSVSGPTIDDCYYLGQRYDADVGYQPGESECWVLVNRTDADGAAVQKLHLGTRDWLTRLWRSPGGTAYVTNATSGEVLVHADPRGIGTEREWRRDRLGSTLNGVWGVDDSFVLAWGSRFEGTHHVHRYDGTSWTEIAAPDFEVRAMHGVADDLVYAVGRDGGVARFDGRSWTRVETSTREVLTGVFVVSADEIYATGADGALLEGANRSWTAAAGTPGLALHDVACFDGELWVAAGAEGLQRRVAGGRELEKAKPALRAVSLDARGKLVAACRDRITEKAEALKFRSNSVDLLRKVRDAAALGEF